MFLHLASYEFAEFVRIASQRLAVVEYFVAHS